MACVYHYTKGYNLSGILRSGEIRCERNAGNYGALATQCANVSGGEPQVWLTTESEMPFTAAPGIGRTPGVNDFAACQRKPTRGYGKWAHIVGGVFRLSFDSNEVGAIQYMTGNVRVQLEKSGMLYAFESVAQFGNDDVTQWYHTSNPIPLTSLKRIERWTSHGGWKQVSINYLARKHAPETMSTFAKAESGYSNVSAQ